MKKIICESCGGYSDVERSFISAQEPPAGFPYRNYLLYHSPEAWFRIYDLFCLMSDISPTPGRYCRCWEPGDPATADLRFRASLDRPSRVTADVIPVLLQMAAATEPLRLAEMRAQQEATVYAFCADQVEDRWLNGAERQDLDQLYRLGAGELLTGIDLVRFDDVEN